MDYDGDTVQVIQHPLVVQKLQTLEKVRLEGVPDEFASLLGTTLQVPDFPIFPDEAEPATIWRAFEAVQGFGARGTCTNAYLEGAVNEGLTTNRVLVLSWLAEQAMDLVSEFLALPLL